MNVPQDENVGAGAAAANAVDPTVGTGSSGQTAQGFEPGMDDPSNVVSDPFFDPVVGSANIGSEQPGTPGRGPYVEPTPTPDGGQPQREAPPTSAAGGPHTQPQQQGGVLGSLAPTLKTLANVLGGGQKGPTGGAASGTPPIAKAVGNLGSFPSGQPQKPGQAPQPQPPQQAPQGTEGGGAPAPASPPTAQGTPPPRQFGEQQPLAAFPTTLAHLAQAARPGDLVSPPEGYQNPDPGMNVAPPEGYQNPDPGITSPTPPTAAQPGQGAGPGAAPGSAAPGAAPDKQVQAITGSPQQSLQNLLEGRTQLPAGAAQVPQGNFAAPDQRMVAQSRLAGTNTAPTAGFSPVLAQERAPYLKEIENPRTALKVATMMSFESSRDPVAVAESLQNGSKYRKSTIDNMVSPRFYGPMRKPRMRNRRMAALQPNPQLMQKYLDAYRTAARGTNLLGGATDQGSGRDPNVRHTGGRVIRFGETYNDWGGGPGGHAGARQFREDQQRRVRGGQAAAPGST